MIWTHSRQLFFAVAFYVSFLNADRWCAESYAEGNQIQEQCSLFFLKQSGIDLTDKYILDVGCGIGNITKKMAETAEHVHGIDSSESMIDFSLKNNSRTNISYELCSIEDFDSFAHFFTYNIAVAFFCTHWFLDKEKAFKNIFNCLKSEGDFLATIITAEESQSSVLFEAFIEAIEKFPEARSFLEKHGLTEAIGSSFPTEKEYMSLIASAGFEIISCKHIPAFIVYRSIDEIVNSRRPIIMSRPIMQMIPEFLREQLFEHHIHILLGKLQKNEDGNYIRPVIHTLVHARKH